MKNNAIKQKAPKRIPYSRNDECDFSVKWQALKKNLFGLGPVARQLDGLRVQLSGPLRQRMGSFQAAPWMISVWAKGQLRAVPTVLWSDYLNYVSVELGESGKQRLEIINQSATEITTDEAQRWCIPVELAESANIGHGNNRVILVAHDAWIEIWEAPQWHNRLNEALSPASQVLPVAPISSLTQPGPTDDQTSNAA